MKKNGKKVIFASLVGMIALSGTNLVYATQELDANVLDSVSSYMEETDSDLAQEVAIRAYCIGKTKEEAKKYVEFGAEMPGNDATGSKYIFEDKALSMYNENAVGVEEWIFGEDEILKCIQICFKHASDTANFDTLDNMEKVMGESYSFTNREIGISNEIWQASQNAEIMLNYNFTGNDETLDDGFNSLNLVYMANTSEETQEKSSGEVKEETPEKEVSTEIVGTVYSDAASVKAVQQALNEKGYNCGTPDGIAGSNTQKQILAYETENGLNVNGVITDELLESLQIADEIRKAAEQAAKMAEYSTDYSYNEIARNPDNYMGKKMKFTGKVLQAQTGSINYARVAINSNYDTILFVTYPEDVIDYRLLEDDQITLYGSCFGDYSYEAVSGATITLPWIEAEIIELK